MPLSPQEIERKQFLMALRGYDKEQVDAFLKELAAEQQALLDSVDAARKQEEVSGPRNGRDPFEGLAAQLESILKHAAKQADQIRSAAAEDTARQREAARRELAEAGTIRAAAQQEAAEVRREQENAHRVRARVQAEAAAAIDDARRELHHLNTQIEAATQRVDQLRAAAAEQSARATELRQAAEREAAALRRDAERETTKLRELAEREAAEVRAAADREAAELRRAAEQEAAEVRAAAEREAGELRDAADWACQESANVLEAADQELRAALQLRAEREQELGIAPVARPSDHAQPGSGSEVRRGDRSRTTSRWFPVADD